jgi:membrane protein DedA with SNARE-associated domain/rhodanese-related sulfurtransferase
MHDLIVLLTQHSMLVIFLVTLAARVGAPLPAAPLLVVAGGLVDMGQIGLTGVLIASLLANLLGDAVWYEAGRRYGHRVLRLLCKVSFSPDSCARQSETLIQRWGGSSLIAAKFLPGISVVAAPMAGALGMSVRRFVGFDLIAGGLWSALFLGLGVAFSGQIEAVLIVIANAGGVATVLLVLALAAFVGARYWRRRQVRKSVEMARITVDDLQRLVDRGEDPVIIDVRTPMRVQAEPRHIPGALRISLAEMRGAATTLPRDRPIVLYCNCPNDVSAARGAAILTAAGFDRVHPLQGGLDGWVASGRMTSAAVGMPDEIESQALAA